MMKSHETTIPDWVEGVLEAARWGDVDELQAWVDSCHLNPTTQVMVMHDTGYSSSSVLHLACGNGHEAILNWALEHCPKDTVTAFLNTPNTQGSTPLHWAVLNAHTTLINRLLSLGANPAIPDGTGKSALTLAELAGHLELASELLKVMSDEEVVDRTESEALKRGLDLDALRLSVKDHEEQASNIPATPALLEQEQR